MEPLISCKCCTSLSLDDFAYQAKHHLNDPVYHTAREISNSEGFERFEYDPSDLPGFSHRAIVARFKSIDYLMIYKLSKD